MVKDYFRKLLHDRLAASYATGEWMFENREAVPTPLGGGTIAHSLISAPQPTPQPKNRYSELVSVTL